MTSCRRHAARSPTLVFAFGADDASGTNPEISFTIQIRVACETLTRVDPAAEACLPRRSEAEAINITPRRKLMVRYAAVLLENAQNLAVDLTKHFFSLSLERAKILRV